MAKILPMMTIQEAAALWSDPQRVHLGKWEREFNQPLEGLHAGHVIRGLKRAWKIIESMPK
jgi:hypothetical protein